MSLVHNVGSISSGLVFCLDAANPKSMRGEGTTNIYASNGFDYWQLNGNHTASRVAGQAPDLNLSNNYDYHTVTASGAWSSETNRAILWNLNASSAYTQGTQYAFSFYARSTSASSGTIGAAFYGNLINNQFNLTSSWQRFTGLSTPNTIYKGFEFGAIGGALTFQIAGFQIEAKAYSTDYANSSRPFTWYDIAGKQYDATFVNSPRVLNNTVQFRSVSSQYATATFDEGVLKPANELGTFSIEVLFKQISNSNAGEAMVAGRQGCHGGIYIDTNIITHAIKTSQANCWEGAVFPLVQTMTNNTWYHTIMSYENGQIRSYVNGNLNATTNFDRATYNMTGYGDTFFIGGIAGRFPNIDLSFVKCYNRAFNDAQAALQYAGVRGRMV